MSKPQAAVDRIAVHEIKLRQASADDLPAVEDLLTKTNLPVEGVNESIDSFIVAESDGHMVGVGGVERCGDYGLLRSVAVDPAAQGRGVGAAVTSKLIADSDAQGLRALYLLTTTADNYFPNFGFARITRDSVPAEVLSTAEFRDLCPASATVMHRTLGRESKASR